MDYILTEFLSSICKHRFETWSINQLMYLGYLAILVTEMEQKTTCQRWWPRWDATLSQSVSLPLLLDSKIICQFNYLRYHHYSQRKSVMTVSGRNRFWYCIQSKETSFLRHCFSVYFKISIQV